MFSILWANPQGVTRAQMSPISGDAYHYRPNWTPLSPITIPNHIRYREPFQHVN